MYRIDGIGNEIVFSGWENGIDASPYDGIADMRNIDVITTPGEASVTFANATVTMPPEYNAVAYTAQNSGDTITLASVTGLYEGCAIVLASNTASGLSDGVVYYVQNIVGLTFQVGLKPLGPVVAVTGDGSGTLTTYQYGNQRSLANNGAPVSYWEAPEVNGVFLVDCSNYAWFWAQTDTNIVAKNHLIFLGNITGIGAASVNQTGICFWQGYVLLLQQQSWVNAISWDRFTSTFDSTFLDTSITYPETFNIALTSDSASSDLMIQGIEILPTDYSGTKPVVLNSGYTANAASSTTVVSGSFVVEQGDTVVAMAYTHNNQSLSGATFNGNAMTSIYSTNSTSPWNFGYASYYYTVGSDMTGTVTATFSGAVTNKFIYVFVVRNGTSFFLMNERYSNNTTSIRQNYYRTHPDALNLMLGVDNSGDTDLNFGDNITTLLNVQQAGGTSYTNLVGYYSNYWDSEETLKKNVPVTVADNNIVYWGNGHQYLASLATAPGQQFNPFQTTSVTTSGGGSGGEVTITPNGYTYNINNAALDLPADERIESVAMAAGTLFLGATSNNLYPWDTISPSFGFPVVLPELSIPNLIPANNILYSLGGNLGRIYVTNNSSATVLKELSDTVTGVEKPYYFFWDANVGNGEIYFSFDAYQNGSVDSTGTTGGVWAVNANTGAWRLVQKPVQGYNVVTRMVCPVGHGSSREMLRPDGQGLLLGYSQGDQFFLEFSTTAPYTDYESYLETEIIPVGTYFSKQTFQHVEYKLGAPLVAGESIRVSQRSDLNSSYTVIAEFTTEGLISDQASINWEDVQWFQLKIELKSTDTDPSFVRLREFRLR